MGPVQKEKRTLNKLELIKINRKARNLLTKFMPRRSIWKDCFVDVEKVFFFFYFFWKGNEEKKRGGKWFTGVCLLKMVFFLFLEGLFLYFMVSEPTRELGCWNNNRKPACLENQTVPVCFFFILWPIEMETLLLYALYPPNFFGRS